MVWIQWKPQKVHTANSSSTDVSSETSTSSSGDDNFEKLTDLPKHAQLKCERLCICCEFMPTSLKCIFLKKLIGLWIRSVLVEQPALLLPPLPVPQLMGSASLHTFSTGRIIEVGLYPPHYMIMFITLVTYTSHFFLHVPLS